MEGEGRTMWKGLKDFYPDSPGKVEERFSDLRSLTLRDDTCLKQARVTGPLDPYAVRKFLKMEKSVAANPPKLLNDPIHGTISLHPLAVLIMNTPQFQRLHYIKQLSAMHYVYPSAGYSRFEHSVGVYHLAGELVNMLKKNQPDLEITAIDAMCVQLAGLCHDLGHGPFSHLFDQDVIPELQKRHSDRETKTPKDWKHEVASADMLYDIYCLHCEDFYAWGIGDNDITFIQSLIHGNPETEETGRDARKSFLYEIVSNEQSGMDVDKWDYLVRDNYHLGVKCGFDPHRLMHHLRVMRIANGDDDEKHICVRSKEHGSIYNMFHTRYDLYRKAYQHPVATGVGMMIAEAIVEGFKNLSIDGKDLLQCLENMTAYTNLDDGIFSKILHSTDQNLEKSKALLRRIQNRNLWKCVGQALIPKSAEKPRREKIVERIKDELASLSSLKGLEFKLKINTRNFGKKEKNPLETIGFYDKEEPTKAYLIEEDARSAILPTEFQRSILFVYCTSECEKLKKREKEICEEVKKTFDKQRLKAFSS